MDFLLLPSTDRLSGGDAIMLAVSNSVVLIWHLDGRFAQAEVLRGGSGSHDFYVVLRNIVGVSCRKYSERGEHIRYQQSRSLDSKDFEYGNPPSEYASGNWVESRRGNFCLPCGKFCFDLGVFSIIFKIIA